MLHTQTSLLLISLLAVSGFELSHAQTDGIPEWVKNSAGWWAEGAISDKEFVSSMQFLVSEGIVEVKDNKQKQKTCDDVYFELITSTIVLDNLSNPDHIAMSHFYDGYRDYVGVMKKHTENYLRLVELVDQCNISESKSNLYGYFHEGILANQEKIS